MPDQRRIRTRHCCCGVAALSPCRRVVVAFLLLLALSSCWVVTAASTSAGPRTSTSSSSHLQRLFNALDSDTDGQLRKHELRQYIHTQHLSTPGHLDGAVDGVIDALDSPDVGLGVSPLELEQHLHTLLEVRVCACETVWRWPVGWLVGWLVCSSSTRSSCSSGQAVLLT